MASTKSAWVHHLGGEIGFLKKTGYQTRYTRAGGGEKPPLIFLHGIGGHTESFIKNVKPLGEAFDDRAVYAIDFIGHGFTDVSPDHEFTLEAYVDQVAGFIEAIGHSEAHLYGESLGGAVATRTAIDRPELVRTLGQITMAGLRSLESDEVSNDAQEESDDGASDLYDRTLNMLEAGVTRETVKHRLDWLFVDDADEELVDIRHTIYSRPPVQEAMPGIYEAAFVDEYEYYTAEELQDLEVPSLLIHTEHNPSSHKELAEVAHDLMPNSEYHLFEHSGHWPQYEEAEKFNDLVHDYISRTE